METRDDLLYERGGPHKLKPGDDSDPAGDAVILQAHKKMGFVPPNADGFSKEHWGHSRISNDSGEHLYNRYTDEQYDAANKRYMQYHGNQIDYVRKLRDGGLVRNLQGRETMSAARIRGFRPPPEAKVSIQNSSVINTPTLVYELSEHRV